MDARLEILNVLLLALSELPLRYSVLDFPLILDVTFTQSEHIKNQLTLVRHTTSLEKRSAVGQLGRPDRVAGQSRSLTLRSP